MLGISFSICCFVFLIILISFYFSKQRLNTLNNKLFTTLMIINIIGVFIDVGGFASFKILGIDNGINIVVSKIYLIYYLTYIFVFMLYIYNISTKSLDKILSKSLIIFVIISIILYFLPIQIHFENNIGYTYGLSVNLGYTLASLMIIFMLYCLIKNIKKIGYKEYIPLFAFVVLTIITISIQKINPEITLLLLSNSIVTYLMYFTIENPDMKILEELYKAKEITDNANEEKTMFLYNMTNEIRQITKDIEDSNNEIEKEISNKKTNKDLISEYIREIKESLTKFNTMTNEILDISQVDINNIKVYNDKYNIKLIIKELIQIYKKKCDNKEIEFRSTIDSDIPEYLYGDSVTLKKVLTILLDNSIKYTSKGFIELSISQIVKRDICRLVITIEDSGKGINAVELNKIFNNKSETQEDKYNLEDNLYNVKKLITIMGGTIIPSSVEAVGTKMKIVLDQRIVNVEKTLDKYEKIIEKKKILLVDDSEASKKIITKLLQDADINLEIVSTGKEALDKIRDKEKYDLILLDEEMKPLDGITVMKKFKEIRSFNTKVILLTKDNNYEYNDEYLTYGFSNYLLKPIDKDKLFKVINE